MHELDKHSHRAHRKVLVRNCDVKRVLVGVPKGHQHVRVVLELKQGIIIELQEATISNILRAFVTVKTHPLVKAMELVGVKLEKRKPGYAEYQLIESNKPDDEVQEELLEILELPPCDQV